MASYFYPRSPRGERRGGRNAAHPAQKISIHAPREGSDKELVGTLPREHQFLSTLPARGATAGTGYYVTFNHNFYPRSPRGERRLALTQVRRSRNISIHAPHEGSDRAKLHRGQAPGHFYPRSPRGERRYTIAVAYATTKFLSTLPTRGATERALNRLWDDVFLSTLPTRGATQHKAGTQTGSKISIHAPHEGSDGVRNTYEERQSIFLSTLPTRGATMPPRISFPTL